MFGSIARVCIWTATVIAFARSVWVVLGFVRTLLRGGSLTATKWGWVEFLVVPEPFVLATVTYALSGTRASSGGPPSPPRRHGSSRRYPRRRRSCSDVVGRSIAAYHRPDFHPWRYLDNRRLLSELRDVV